MTQLLWETGQAQHVYPDKKQYRPITCVHMHTRTHTHTQAHTYIRVFHWHHFTLQPSILILKTFLPLKFIKCSSQAGFCLRGKTFDPDHSRNGWTALTHLIILLNRLTWVSYLDLFRLPHFLQWRRGKHVSVANKLLSSPVYKSMSVYNEAFWLSVTLGAPSLSRSFYISSHISAELLLGNTLCDLLFAPLCEKQADSLQRHNKETDSGFHLNHRKLWNEWRKLLNMLQ